MVVVGDNGAAGVHPLPRQACLHERSRHDARAEQLAHGRDDVKRPNRRLVEHGRRLDDGGELVELLVNMCGEFGRIA